MDRRRKKNLGRTCKRDLSLYGYVVVQVTEDTYRLLQRDALGRVSVVGTHTFQSPETALAYVHWRDQNVSLRNISFHVAAPETLRANTAREWLKRYKADRCCAICGAKENLTFHHVRQKRAAVSQLIYQGAPMRAIRREVRKCVLLCRECHDKVHGCVARHREKAAHWWLVSADGDLHIRCDTLRDVLETAEMVQEEIREGVRAAPQSCVAVVQAEDRDDAIRVAFDAAGVLRQGVREVLL